MGCNIGSVPQIVCVTYSESSLALELSSELLFLEEVEESELFGTEKAREKGDSGTPHVIWS